MKQKLEVGLIRCHEDIWDAEKKESKVRINNPVKISGREGVVIEIEHTIPYNKNVGTVKIKDSKGRKIEYVVYKDHVGAEVIG
jgi:hypothetical protein